LNPSTEGHTLGVDLGSSYVKAVLLDEGGRIVRSGLRPTGYDYREAVEALLPGFPAEVPRVGLTGYGRKQVLEGVRKTEISCLAKALLHEGVRDATVVDIGGQDCKLLRIEGGRLASHHLNRRCAAGTGSYLEFMAYRLGLDCGEMTRLSAQTRECRSLNSYCTVFASTEILDCLRRRVPLPQLVRGMYASIAERVGEMAPLEPPLYLAGGVVAHHPAVTEIFSAVHAVDVHEAPRPQFLAAQGAALYARDAT